MLEEGLDVRLMGRGRWPIRSCSFIQKASSGFSGGSPAVCNIGSNPASDMIRPTASVHTLAIFLGKNLFLQGAKEK